MKYLFFIGCMGLVFPLLGQGPGRNGPVVLTAGDSAAFPQPPPGFEDSRPAIAHGRLDSVYYDSRTVGNKRRCVVYTPPGYSSSVKYPVLYLLHGIGGDEKEWLKYCRPELILDNLVADGKMVPAIVVFPNGRAMPDDRAGGNIFDPEKVRAFANFEHDLVDDLIPFVERSYPVIPEAQSRAIAGFSMGGGQSLNFGLGHPDVFAWVGGFSSAPNTKKPEELAADPAALVSQTRLIYLSCGDQDGLIRISRDVHAWLLSHKVPHIYHIQPGKHDIDPWKKDLYHFAQLIFRPVPPAPRPGNARNPGDTLQSVRVLPDNRVTFSLYAPRASEVTVAGDFLWGAPAGKMTRNDKGIWTFTTSPVSPDAYTYDFSVDGITVMDTRSPTFRENPNALFNFFVMPGAQTSLLTIRNVPHGRVEKVMYHSHSLDAERRMHVYLPPGFEKLKGKLPVLYLLHGGGDNDISWTSAGLVNVILDNLYAEGKVKEMIVVMPSGHTPAGGARMGAGPDQDPFCKDFYNDILPFVERTYPVSAKRQDRAIAGFSMGGIQTLNIALWHPELFGYVCPMGTGYFPSAISEIEEKYMPILKNPEINRFSAFIIGRGKEDQLTAANSRATLAFFDRTGVRYQYIEMPGGHSFVFTRRFIAYFLPKLF